ncbi:MAG: DUF4389 domain-containing protein [Paracoccaceae bacterium]|nr:DUF4389 domain-containing protein [Paracoccaceae bacterium]
MSGHLKDNIVRRSIWLRLVFMIVMGVAYSVAEIVTLAVVVFQFLGSLISGKPNDRLARFGRNLARYFQQITVYMTFTTEEKPFPFAPWPDEPHEEAAADEDSNELNASTENADDGAMGEERNADNAKSDGTARDTDKSTG